MNESADGQGPPPAAAAAGKRKSPVDRWVKLGFAVVFLGVVGVVTYLQLRGPMLGWPDDLTEALAQARRENRRVVVLVRSFPASNACKRMVQTTLAKAENKAALEEGKFILVEIRFARDADWAKRYEVSRTPTMLVIAPDGKRFHKQEGFIGETAFRDVFLKARLR